MRNTVRLKKLVALAMAIILMAGMSPLDLVASMMETEVVTITRFEPLDPDVAHQFVPFGTTVDELNLPAVLEVVAEVQTVQGFWQLSGSNALLPGFNAFGTGIGSTVGVGLALTEVELTESGADEILGKEAPYESYAYDDYEMELQYYDRHNMYCPPYLLDRKDHEYYECECGHEYYGTYYDEDKVVCEGGEKYEKYEECDEEYDY